MSGRPVIRGTRVPAEDVGRLAAERDGRRILKTEYKLTDEQINDGERWWDTVVRYDAA